MFKKSEPETPRHDDETFAEAPARPASQPRAAEHATIGPSIRIRGDLTGEEDLVVQGHVEGTISLRSNSVTIGKDGHLSATVDARVINVEGQVEGDLNGNEQVIVRRSGNVRGNIAAPRVTLEDGCHFKGSIDMDVESPSDKVTDLKPAAQSGDGTAKNA